MSIAAVIALVGSVGCLFLVRQKDFVPSVASGDWSGPQSVDGPGPQSVDGPDLDGHAAGRPPVGAHGLGPATGDADSTDEDPTRSADVRSG